jgi:uncharacterized protein YbjT (DUF2867 family)
MRLVVLGASGNVGSRVVESAVAGEQGYQQSTGNAAFHH